jgi:PAP2 superfamily C-terminal
MAAFNNYITTTLNAWKVALKDKLFGIKLLVVPGLFFIYSAITQQLGNYIEMRKGIHLDDKLLTLFPRFDFSAPIFFLLYVSLFVFIITHLHKPKIILRLIEMHFLVAIIRQLCILLVPLDPPTGIIVLKDVLLENTFYPHHTPLTKDLFFSGHVASICIYFLCTYKKYLKICFGCAALLMSFMILSMRVHYTYDVYGAVFFTSVIYFAPTWLRPYFASNRKLSVSK